MLDQDQQRDAMKIEAAKKHGITLVRVPWWWDYQPER